MQPTDGDSWWHQPHATRHNNRFICGFWLHFCTAFVISGYSHYGTISYICQFYHLFTDLQIKWSQMALIGRILVKELVAGEWFFRLLPPPNLTGFCLDRRLSVWWANFHDSFGNRVVDHRRYNFEMIYMHIVDIVSLPVVRQYTTIQNAIKFQIAPTSMLSSLFSKNHICTPLRQCADFWFWMAWRKHTHCTDCRL